MTAPVLVSRADAIYQLTLPLTRLRALLLHELGTQAMQEAECRATMRGLTGQTDVDSVLEREVAEASANRAERAIADVEHAIARLDEGTYGTCERCSAAIPVERLEAIPYARRCVNCPEHRGGIAG